MLRGQANEHGSTEAGTGANKNSDGLELQQNPWQEIGRLVPSRARLQSTACIIGLLHRWELQAGRGKDKGGKVKFSQLHTR